MTFEEEFPSLNEKAEENCWWGYGEKAIQENCIDKQRHEELLKRALAKERQRVREAIEKVRNLDITSEHYNCIDYEELLKELRDAE